MDSIFFEISAIIVVSTALALVARLLKQPTILAFILAGIILGPIGLNILQSHELIDVLSEFGIAFVLFMIGIELDLKKFKELNTIAIISGLGQILFTGLIGYLVAQWLNFNSTESWFIAIALTLSSTIIIVKLLSEKRQIDSLYGRITLAILIIQDLFAVVALVVIESYGNSPLATAGIPWNGIFITGFKAIFVTLLAFGLARYIFKGIFKFIGHSQDLLFLWSIAWCLLFAGLSLYMNFSIAIGVFVAGLALSTLDYNFEIAARIRPLRDFFIVIFFSFLGSQLLFTFNSDVIISGIILSLFVLVLNPIIVYVILSLSHQTQRTALFTGLAIGQISEFSFIIANTGLEHNLIQREIVSMIAMIGLITMTISTYAITYNEQIYRFVRRGLAFIPFLPKSDDHELDVLPKDLNKHVVIFGYYAAAVNVIESLKKIGKDIVVIDYNPSHMESIKQQGVYYIYGDMRDEDILKRAELEDASMIISLVPYREATLSLLQYAKHFKIKADLIVSARHLPDVETYYEAGAKFVLHPESISLDYLRRVLDNEEVSSASKAHRKDLLRQLQNIEEHF